MGDVLQSDSLSEHGFAHGFSLRGAEERLAEAAGLDPERLFVVSQVHGARAVVLEPGALPEAVRTEEADALVATEPGDAVAVRVADCVPVIFADPRTGAVAAAHAGWRGCVAGVLTEAVAAMGRAAGTRPADLVAAIGPHIRVDAFEVGEEVAAELEAAAPGDEVVVRGRAKPHVDLARVVRAQLHRAGVAPDRIDDVGGCTHTDPDRFHSYRRDGKRAGRHLGAIAARRV